MTREASKPTSKRYTLIQHWNDVSMWWHDMKDGITYTSSRDDEVIFFTAYERWLNDRELLSIENDHVFDSYLPDPVLDHPGRVARDRSAYS